MQSATTRPPGSTPRRASLPWPVILAAILMLYTFGVAGALLGSLIAPDLAWLLMALPCAAPMAWCAAGFIRNLGTDDGETDAGLLISALGWAFVGAGLILKYAAILAARPDAYASQASSPATPFCVGAGIVCILIGAGVSFYAWSREQNQPNSTY